MDIRRFAALAALLVGSAGLISLPAYAQQPSADVSVTKADSPDPVTAGRRLTYTVTVANNGPDRATGATVTDTLPPGVTFVSADASNGNCTGTAPVSCNLGALRKGETAKVTIVVRPRTAGTLTNRAQVSANQGDPNTANNADTTTTRVVAAPARCTVTGTAGADVLRGTPGADVICALGGGDVIYGRRGDDVVRAGAGQDVIYAGGGNDRVGAGDGRDVVYGGTGNDRIAGGRGGDVLYGNAGRDALFGGRGFDVLIGGPGSDLCRQGLDGGIRIAC
ncbi:MAG TPA: hypothetical protein VF521_00770 [Pyrinomonadaceae bacterium]|jgi:uncharacterized repeat protein (TIGR01451 family)